ncbi:SDR family oxidoreductase [Mesoaciditoga sp.]
MSEKTKVIVTGGAGFIGSNIVDALLEMGMTPIVIDDLSTGKEENVNPDAIMYRQDTRDLAGLEKIFSKHRPDYVLHLAAQISVSRSVREPIYDESVNIKGTLNVLEMCHKYGVKKIVFTSSGGVMYGENPPFPTPESVCPDPISPYGISKLAGEKYVRFYGFEKGLRYTILRYGNVYGPRQSPDGEAGVIAIFAKKMLNKEPVTINGDGEYVRDYIYVKDVVNANILSMENGDGEIFNIGTGTGKSVNDVFLSLKEHIYYDADPIYGPPRPGDLRKSILDISHAKEVLKWKPKYSFSEGLRETVSFFESRR